MKKTYRKYTPFVTGTSNSMTALNASLNSLQDDVQQLYMDFLSRYEYVTTGIPKWSFRSTAAPSQLEPLKLGIANTGTPVTDLSFNGVSTFAGYQLQLNFGPRNTFPNQETTANFNVPFCSMKVEDGTKTGYIYFTPLVGALIGTGFVKDVTLELKRDVSLTPGSIQIDGTGQENVVVYGSSTYSFFTKYVLSFCEDPLVQTDLPSLVTLLGSDPSFPFTVSYYDPGTVDIVLALPSYDKIGIFCDQPFALFFSGAALTELQTQLWSMLSTLMVPATTQEKNYIVYVKVPYTSVTDPTNSSSIYTTSNIHSPVSVSSASDIVTSWGSEVTSQSVGGGIAPFGDKYTLVPIFWRMWDIFSSVDGTVVNVNDLTATIVNNSFIPIFGSSYVIALTGTTSHTHDQITISGIGPAWDSYLRMNSDKTITGIINSKVYLHFNGSPGTSILSFGDAGKSGTTSSNEIQFGTTGKVISDVTGTGFHTYTNGVLTDPVLTVSCAANKKFLQIGTTGYGYSNAVTTNDNAIATILSEKVSGNNYRPGLLIGTYDSTATYTKRYTAIVNSEEGAGGLTSRYSTVASAMDDGLLLFAFDNDSTDKNDYLTNALSLKAGYRASLQLLLSPSADTALASGKLSVLHGVPLGVYPAVVTRTEIFTVNAVKNAGVWDTHLNFSMDDVTYKNCFVGSTDLSVTAGVYTGHGLHFKSGSPSNLQGTIIVSADVFEIYLPDSAAVTPYYGKVLSLASGVLSVPNQFGFTFGYSYGVTPTFAVTYDRDGVVDNLDYYHEYFPIMTASGGSKVVSCSQPQLLNWSTFSVGSGLIPGFVKNARISEIPGTPYDYSYFQIPATYTGTYNVQVTLPVEYSRIYSAGAGLDAGRQYAYLKAVRPVLKVYRSAAALSNAYATFMDFDTDFSAFTEYASLPLFTSVNTFSTTMLEYSINGQVDTNIYLEAGFYYAFKVSIEAISTGSTLFPSDALIQHQYNYAIGKGCKTIKHSIPGYSGGADISGAMIQMLKLN